MHMIRYGISVGQNKAATNFSKYGIDFVDAVVVFSDDLAVTVNDERFDEERVHYHWCRGV